MVLASMAAVVPTRGSAFWLRIERTIIVLLAVLYIGNTLVELADMVGAITLHPAGENAYSLLSSSVAIWIANVLAFSLSYRQLDRGGPAAANAGSNVRPDWVFPQPAATGNLHADWRCSSTISISVTRPPRRSPPLMRCRSPIGRRC
jgi:hypothetical protein